MWIAENWKDYEILDTSEGEKLERWADYILLRPDPQVLWNTPKKIREWKQLNGHYHRSSKGGGNWEFFDLPEEWTINYKLKEDTLTFHLKPFSFKHTGLFPEQAVNWDWTYGLIKNRINEAKSSGNSKPIKVLNLFAYTGGATLAAAAAGLVLVLEKPMKLSYGRMRLIVLIYGFCLFSTVSVSGLLWLEQREPGLCLIFIGSVLFAVSDLILSGTFFGNGKDRPVDIISNYLFYYSGQFLIAYSLVLLK